MVAHEPVRLNLGLARGRTRRRLDLGKRAIRAILLGLVGRAEGRSLRCQRRCNQEGAVSVRLFIGNLPYTATEADLREHLSSVGVPASVVLPDRPGDRPPARLRVRRLRRSRGRRGGDPAIQPAAVQGTAAWRSARRGRAKTVRRARRGPAASAARGPRRGPGGAPGGFGARRARAASRRARRSGGGGARPAQPELRSRRAAQEQAQAAAQGSDRGPKGPIKERPVSRSTRTTRTGAREPDEEEPDNVAAASAKGDDDPEPEAEE